MELHTTLSSNVLQVVFPGKGAIAHHCPPDLQIELEACKLFTKSETLREFVLPRNTLPVPDSVRRLKLLLYLSIFIKTKANTNDR